MESVCALPSVEGEVVSVPSGYYDSWDQQPWNVELANGVTEHIRSLILGYLQSQPSIKYVVLVGDDEVIPQRRVPDGTVLSNERAYADFSALTSDSPLPPSMYDSQMLTDDFYVDTQPIAYDGHFPLHPDPLRSRVLSRRPPRLRVSWSGFPGNKTGTLGGWLCGHPLASPQDFMLPGAKQVQLCSLRRRA